MNKVHQKVELTANILIIVVALAIGGVLAQKYLLDGASMANKQLARVQPTIGSKVNLTDVNWSEQAKTLVLALQSNCRFCKESAPFYKRMLEATKGRNIKFVAVFPTKAEESTSHLKELGITDFEVKQAPISALNAGGTPTLILTNEKGEVTNFWVGKLTAEKEMEVISQLNS